MLRATNVPIAGVLLGLVLTACGAEPPSTTTGDGNASGTTTAIPATTAAKRDTTTSTVDVSTTITTDPDPVFGGPAFPEAPPAVSAREALFYCGAEAMDERVDAANPYPHIELRRDAGACYHERAAAGLPSEMITVGYTIEGDPFLTIRRLQPEGREVYFWDATQDSYGPGAWVLTECDHYSGTGPTEEFCRFDIEITDG